MWLSYVDRYMKIPLQPTAQTRPVPIKTVTFHDEGYLGVLF